MISGLKSKEGRRLNGAVGTVLGFPAGNPAAPEGGGASAERRVEVLVKSTYGSKRVALKHTNMRLALASIDLTFGICGPTDGRDGDASVPTTTIEAQQEGHSVDSAASLAGLAAPGPLFELLAMILGSRAMPPQHIGGFPAGKRGGATARR